MTFWPYPIDWAATGSWMQAYAGFAAAGAVVYAAHRGSSSFKQWLKQKHTERQIAVGEEILTIAYAATDAFIAIRSRATLGYESERAHNELTKTIADYKSKPKDDQDRLQIAQVVLHRLGEYHDLWLRCQNALPSARVIYSNEVKESLQKILGLRAQVASAAQIFAQLPQWDPSMAKIFLNDEPIESDPIRNEMRAVLVQLEAAVSPKLSSA